MIVSVCSLVPLPQQLIGFIGFSTPSRKWLVREWHLVLLAGLSNLKLASLVFPVFPTLSHLASFDKWFPFFLAGRSTSILSHLDPVPTCLWFQRRKKGTKCANLHSGVLTGLKGCKSCMSCLINNRCYCEGSLAKQTKERPAWIWMNLVRRLADLRD